MKPASTTYEIGSTIYEQPLTLTWARDSAGIGAWHLRKGAYDQRDDEVLISGITDHVLRAIADALKDKVERGI